VLTLAVETSCDETSAALVENGRVVRANAVSSQIELHAPFGGVVPEVASRQHVRAITHVVREALHQADALLGDVDVVCATHGPGLAGALLVGLTFGRALALGLDIPFLPVNHLEGHIFSVWLTREAVPPVPPDFPLLTLIVSGGHTELVLVRAAGQYEPLGRTLDDAAGEAFDKVARLLGLGYPGGPHIQRAAAGAVTPVRLPRAWLPDTYDFSFSGLKTAALHVAHASVHGNDSKCVRGLSLPRADLAGELSSQEVADIAAGFQESVVDVLVKKTALAARRHEVAAVAVVGGVAANKLLGERMTEAISVPLFIAPLEFSTDNAAMIAAAAFFGPPRPVDAEVRPGLSLVG
jgi:N6-L-threonylcarbamoyladenine synthase